MRPEQVLSVNIAANRGLRRHFWAGISLFQLESGLEAWRFD
jgi:hypothetical protein